jgi:hypothetical protein
MPGVTEASLRAAINEFVFADNWSESRWVLEKHPELLTDDAAIVLSHIKAMARETGDTHSAELAGTYQNLLRRCRIIGARAAFAELTGGEFPPLTADLIRICDAAAIASGSIQETQDVAALSRAMETFEAGIREQGAVLGSAPLETIEYILCLAINLRLQRFNAQHLRDDLETSLGYWEALLREASGSLTALSALGRGTGGAVLLQAAMTGRGTLPAAVEALEHAVAATPPGPERDGYSRNLGYARQLSAER